MIKDRRAEIKRLRASDWERFNKKYGYIGKSFESMAEAENELITNGFVAKSGIFSDGKRKAYLTKLIDANIDNYGNPISYFPIGYLVTYEQFEKIKIIEEGRKWS